MHGAVGLYPLCRGREAAGQAVVFLESVVHFHLAGDLVPHLGAEGRLHAPLDDEYHLVKARGHGIVNGVLHQDLSVGAHVIHLLGAAPAVAGTQTGGHNQQRFLHRGNHSSFCT